MEIEDDILEAAAFSAWASETPYAGRTLADLRSGDTVMSADMGSGVSLEHDLLLDWEMNRETFTVLARAVLEGAEAARKRRGVH